MRLGVDVRFCRSGGGCLKSVLDVIGGFDSDSIPGKLQEARARKKKEKETKKTITVIPGKSWII